MISSRHPASFVAALAVWTLAGGPSGCGDGKPSVDTSLNEATVTGVVSVKGKPATGGRSISIPATRDASYRPKSADIGPDGTYIGQDVHGR